MKTTLSKLATKSLAISFLTIVVGTQAHSHSLTTSGSQDDGTANEEPPLDEFDDVLQGIINGAKVWNTDHPVEVCFMDGETGTHSYVLETISDWEQAARGLEIDGLLDGKPRICASQLTDIRISFQSHGNWSYVGTDASNVLGKRPTLNIGALRGALTNRKRKEARGTVLHEFGHALGMHHEHQHPDSDCEAQLNWQVVYEKLGSPPNSWSEKKVDRNIRPVTKRRYEYTPYDRESVMHYELPALFFIQGKDASCYVERGNQLSDGDKALISAKYPEKPSDQVDYLQNLTALSQKIVNTLEAEQGKLFADAFNEALPQSFTNEFGGITYEGDFSIDIQTGDVVGGAVVGQSSGNITINNNGNSASK